MIITKNSPFSKEEIEKLKRQLGDLSLDLKRVAIGYNRGSIRMAERFFEEALKRRDELDRKKVKPYLVKFILEMDNINRENMEKAAEDALMYSTIFQNASQSLNS